MTAALRWLLPLMMLSRLIVASDASTHASLNHVFVTPTRPVITSLNGCTELNSTALDQCSTAGSFYLSGYNLQSQRAPLVKLMTDNGQFTFPCSYTNSSQTSMECILPDNDSLEGFWWSVSVFMHGELSPAVSPGIYITPYVPGAPCPNVESISAACDPTGCVNGIPLTIVGTQLIDNNSDATVSLAPNFFSSPDDASIDCPIDFDFSTDTLMYCILPVLPSQYLGQNLQVRVTNAWGSGIIGGWLMYDTPSSSSTGLSPISSTGPVIPPPPFYPPFPGWSSSASFGFTWIVSVCVVFILVLFISALASRRSASRRALLSANSSAPQQYVPLHNQPVHMSQPVYFQYPAPVYWPAQGAYADVHAPQYVQPEYAQPQYAQPQEPLAAGHYQPAPYAQYSAGPYQPSAPSAYPHVHYQGHQVC